MAKVTEVYMKIDGEQTRFTMKEYLAMRENDTRVRALKFIPIDHRMYEATPEQFKAWKREQNRRAYLKTHAPAYTEVSYDALMKEDGTPASEFIADETADIAGKATANVLLETLQSALAQLTGEERQLVQAIFFDGVTEREYARKLGISQPAVHKRLVKILGRLKKYLGI